MRHGLNGGWTMARAGLAAAATLAVLLGGPARATAASGSWLPATPPDWPLVTGEQLGPTQTLTSGITHSTDTLETVSGRQVGQVLDVDLSDPNVRAGVVDAGNQIVDENDEALSSMAARTNAVAGVNGDFFEWQDDGDPVDMVVQHGQLWKSPSPSGHLADFLLLDDGTAVVTSETFSGTVTDGASSQPLAAVNTLDPQPADGISLVTAQEGAIGSLDSSEVVTGHLVDGGSKLAVDSVQSGVTSLPALGSGQEALVATGTGASWMASTIHAGDDLTISDSLSPYPLSQIDSALSGGAILVANGQMAVPVTGSGENNQNLGVTAVGVTADGRHLIAATFDGEQPESEAEGLTRPQIAQWMIAHGAQNAILFDTGGSAEMVGRLPGQTQASVLNTPSDGHERPLADGLFFYSTETGPGPATQITLDGGRPLTLLAGASATVTADAVDADANPAAQTPVLGVADGSLASAHGDTVTAGDTPGATTLTASAGGASARVGLRVVTRLAHLSISPTQPDVDDVDDGATQQLTVSATAPDGAPVSLSPADVTWSTSAPALGGIDHDGLFGAAATGTGLATVTATAGGATAHVTIAVGQSSRTIDPLTSTSNWTVAPYDGATGTVTASGDSPGSFAQGSLKLDFTYPAGFGFKQFYLTPKSPETIPTVDGRDPDEVGIWIRGDGEDPVAHTPLSHGNLSFGMSLNQSDDQSLTFWPSTITYSGWRLLVARLPAGTQFPLTVSFLCFIDELPPSTTTGSVEFSDLQALYSPRPGAAPTRWAPAAPSPRWLTQSEDPAMFGGSGTTLGTIADAQVSASGPAGVGTTALHDLPGDLAALPAGARPSQLLALGDMSATGAVADLQAARSALTALGLPALTAVGEDETSVGADLENGNFASVFGATHEAARVGDADVLVLDDSAGGITASDPDQSPAQEQYQWLVTQLDADRSPVTLVSLSLPVTDPAGSAGDQFADRDEAQQLELLLNRFQATHPATHVIVLSGQRSGFQDETLGADGTPDPAGVPNLQLGDLGLAPTQPADAGGIEDYGLLHVGAGGQVGYAVVPLLGAVSIDPVPARLAPGRRVTLRATGTDLAAPGQTAPAASVPIADPLAHRWTSSRPGVAAIDPDSGRLWARAPGRTTITLVSGGVRATAVIAVRR